MKHKSDNEMANVLDYLDLDFDHSLDTERQKTKISQYCEEFDNLNPNYDYYRYIKLGEKLVN